MAKELRIDGKVVMKKFCYNYAKSLLAKLQELSDEGFAASGSDEKLEDVAYCVAASLREQIHYKGSVKSIEEAENLIRVAEEFLACFETIPDPAKK